jgi:hypothetical protein
VGRSEGELEEGNRLRGSEGLDVIGPSAPSDSVEDKDTGEWDIEMGDDLHSFLGSKATHE